MRSLATRTAAAIAVVMALAGCTSSADGGTAAPAERSTSQPPCQDAIAEGCRELIVGDRSYRYYLSPPPSGATGQALLVDLGGPGLSLGSILPPGYGTSFRTDLARVADGKSLLLIEEPWVSGQADASCRDTSAQFYSWVRRNWRNLPSGAPAMNCPWGQGVYGWNRDTYRAVVSAIVNREHIRGLDMAAISFGAVRYSYIDDMIGYAALVRPAAAPGTTSDDITSARAAQVWKSLATRCGCGIAATKSAVTKTINHYRTTSLQLPDRSVAFTDFDTASALVAAGISTAQEPDLGWTGAGATVDAETAAQFSDALWLRVGVESVSPALVAYTDEYCQAYPAGTSTDTEDPIRAILGAPALCTGQQTRQSGVPQPVNCLIVGAQDASAPAALATTWNVSSSGRTSVSQVRKHWFSDMSTCPKADE